jgi:O6-methylguanine-DNA--protein-cysteine methyltransferase
LSRRKSFQKAVTENPNAFEENDDEEPPPPIADATKKLNEIAEYRNEQKAAQEFVKQLTEQQRELENQAKASPRGNHPKLSEQQRQIQRSLEDFQQRHPQPFKGLEQNTTAACNAMGKAADALRQKATGAYGETAKATREIENLGQAMANHSADRQMADAAN